MRHDTTTYLARKTAKDLTITRKALRRAKYAT